MTAFLVLILVAVLITASVEAISKLKDYIVLKDWELFKIGVPASWLLAIIAGVTLNIGMAETILNMGQVEFAFSPEFHVLDVAFSIMLLSQGAAFVIDVYNQWKDMREQFK